MPKRTDISKVLILGSGVVSFVLFLAVIPMFACQETCVWFEVSGTNFILQRFNPETRANSPVANAQMIVRDASPNARGQDAICARRGDIVRRIQTDSDGNFDLKGIHAGRYWITYIHPEDGQSFLVSIAGKQNKKRTELVTNNLNGACYVIDVEKNVTRPFGWAIPVDLDLRTSSPMRIHCKNLKLFFRKIQVANQLFRITKLEPKSSNGVTVEGWNHALTQTLRTDNFGVIELTGDSTGPYLIEPAWKSELSRVVFSNFKQLEECTEEMPLNEIVTQVDPVIANK
jgi:hypothetical protein